MEQERLSSPEATHRIPHAYTLILFTVTLFTGAFLVFWIEPLIAKMLLPYLGGAPAVWIVSMVFFQASLLGGYLYAHGIATRMAPKRQLAVHLLALIFAAAFLPFAIESQWIPSEGVPPSIWLLSVLLGSIGAPFFVVSATAPLLQYWFSQTAHRHASDPYFLYSASNVGSVGGLLLFPAVFEPLMTLRTQSLVWTGAFVVLAVLICMCGLLVRARSNPAFEVPKEAAKSYVTRRQRLTWIVLSMVPSALLLGVTNHITTDLAAAPLLWVIPLVLYLLSFVIVFSRRPLIPHAMVVRLLPIGIVVLAGYMALHATGMTAPVSISVPLHLVAFFWLCLACHGELVRRRPPVGALTTFYIFLSLGGMLGGAGTALLAPLLFSGVYEYPLALVAACLLMPTRSERFRFVDLLIVASILGLFVLWRILPDLLALQDTIWRLLFLFIILLTFIPRRRPIGFALCIAALFATSYFVAGKSDTILQVRGFFGVHRVEDTADGRYRLLFHGTTIHGAQRLDASNLPTPATYYAPDSPIAEVIFKTRGRSGALTSVGLIGLGTGSLLCYRQEGERWRYFEIDPLVLEIAKSSGLFSFMEKCGPDVPVTLGDGRLNLENWSEEPFDLLVVDAFSSDAIPIHLLTREAILVYFDTLAPDGLLALHISNKHLDLVPVVSRIKADLGLSGRVAYKSAEGKDRYDSTRSQWAILARDDESLRKLELDGIWKVLKADMSERVWTDDYSNLLGTVRWWP